MTEDVRAALREAGQRRTAADQDRDAAMRQIADLLLAGRDVGLSITEMADLAGVTRQTVYDMLARVAS